MLGACFATAIRHTRSLYCFTGSGRDALLRDCFFSAKCGLCMYTYLPKLYAPWILNFSILHFWHLCFRDGALDCLARIHFDLVFVCVVLLPPRSSHRCPVLLPVSPF